MQCKNVISKLRRKLDKDGCQVFPLLYDFLKRNENYGLKSIVGKTSGLLDLQKIEQRVDNLEYNGVADFIADVQLMLKSVIQFCNYSHEVCMLFLFRCLASCLLICVSNFFINLQNMVYCFY